MYDIDKLLEEISRSEQNIAEMERVIKKERTKIARYSVFVEQAEGVLRAHHPNRVCEVKGHKWHNRVLFPDGPYRGEWQKRECIECSATEQRGHGI